MNFFQHHLNKFFLRFFSKKSDKNVTPLKLFTKIEFSSDKNSFELFDYKHEFESFEDIIPSSFILSMGANCTVLTFDKLPTICHLKLSNCDWNEFKDWKFENNFNILVNLEGWVIDENFENASRDLIPIFDKMYQHSLKNYHFYLYSIYSKSRVPTFFAAYLMYCCRIRGLEASFEKFHDYVFVNKPFDLRLGHASFLYYFHEHIFN